MRCKLGTTKTLKVSHMRTRRSVTRTRKYVTKLSENNVTMHRLSVLCKSKSEHSTFDCTATPLRFHLAATDTFITLLDELVHCPLTETSVLWHLPSCHKCLHLAIVFNKSLHRRGKQAIAQQRIPFIQSQASQRL